MKSTNYWSQSMLKHESQTSVKESRATPLKTQVNEPRTLY